MLNRRGGNGFEFVSIVSFGVYDVDSFVSEGFLYAFVGFPCERFCVVEGSHDTVYGSFRLRLEGVFDSVISKSETRLNV